jgi:hypothetical protein
LNNCIQTGGPLVSATKKIPTIISTIPNAVLSDIDSFRKRNAHITEKIGADLVTGKTTLTLPCLRADKKKKRANDAETAMKNIEIHCVLDNI